MGARIIYPLVFVLVCFLGCRSTLKEEVSRPEQALDPVLFFPPAFKDDMDVGSLKEAINRNLVYLNKLEPERVFQYGPDQVTCKMVIQSQELFLHLISEETDWDRLNRKIQNRFTIYRAAGRPGNRHVLFTGYFEPVFEASHTPDEIFQHPLYCPPKDLIKIDLSFFSKKFKGERIMARIEGNQVLPYFTRQRIDIQKCLKGRELEIAWLKDPIDAVFLHIQGSGRLQYPDGKIKRVGYAASNGRPYRSIGRYMIKRNYLKREKVSMQGIREYLAEHPEACEDVLACNPSYVFFRFLDSEPVGNINVPLVAGRSLALDARLFPKGALAFMSCQKPDVDEAGNIVGWRNFSRFVLNQDTGGAIKGAGRADLFWGAGDYAATAAGHMKHDGELYVLIKKPEH